MARRPIPNVNASLIHEARMLFQQFFGGRSDNYYSMRVAEAQAKAQRPVVCTHTVLKCSFCGGVPNDAAFVINGYSACPGHEAKARSATNTPRFNL
jgi:hypothetical protein